MDSGLLYGGVGFAVAITLILLEVPVAVAMGLIALSGCALILGVSATVTIGATTIWDALTNYTLTMLPLFVLMGNLAAQSGLYSGIFTANETAAVGVAVVLA